MHERCPKCAPAEAAPKSRTVGSWSEKERAPFQREQDPVFSRQYLGQFPPEPKNRFLPEKAWTDGLERSLYQIRSGARLFCAVLAPDHGRRAHIFMLGISYAGAPDDAVMYSEHYREEHSMHSPFELWEKLARKVHAVWRQRCGVREEPMEIVRREKRRGL